MFGLRFRALENLVDQLTPASHMKAPTVKPNWRNEFPVKISNPFEKKEKELVKVLVNDKEVSISAKLIKDLSKKEDELCGMIDDVINAISHETAKDKKDNIVDFIETLDADISYADMSKAIDEFMSSEVQETEAPVVVINTTVESEPQEINITIEVAPTVEEAVTEEAVVIENTFTTTTGDEDEVEYVDMTNAAKKEDK